MKKTKITNLVKEYVPGEKTLVGIKVETEEKVFTIPVADVRTNDDSRRKVESIEKAEKISRGSKFFNPSYSVLGQSYNISRKDA